MATQNWISGQVAGTAAYTSDNWDWLRASVDSKTSRGFGLVKAKVHMVRGKVRFYFSGFSKFNAVFGPGGFGPGHDRIVNIFAGHGQMGSSLKAVTNGIAGTFARATLVFFFGSATAYAEWMGDTQKDGYDRAAALFTGMLKAVIAAGLAVLVVAIVVIVIMGMAASSVSVIAIGAITVNAGLLMNYVVDAADKSLGRLVTGNRENNDGMAASIAPLLRKAGEELQESWS